MYYIFRQLLLKKIKITDTGKSRAVARSAYCRNCYRGFHGDNSQSSLPMMAVSLFQFSDSKTGSRTTSAMPYFISIRNYFIQ